MLQNELDKLMEIDYEKTMWMGGDIARRLSPNRLDSVDFIILSAMALLTRKNDFDKAEDLQRMIDSEVGDFATKGKLFGFVGQYWEAIKEFSNKAGMKELLAATLLFDPNIIQMGGYGMSSPCELSVLSNRILDIKPEDTVLNLCSGMAGYLSISAISTGAAKLIGMELSTDNIIVANVRSLILENSFEVHQGNVLTMDCAEFGANKVFSNHPFGLIGHDNYELLYPRLREQLNIIRNVRKKDWFFTYAAINSQKAGGKTVVVATDSQLFHLGADTNIRKELTDSGKLEAVISLPAKLYIGTNVKVNLLVFSDNNKTVKMIEAKDMGTTVKNRTKLSMDDIDSIMEYYDSENDSNYSRHVTIEEIKKNDYVWMPSTYLQMDIPQYDNAVSLKEVSVEVNRGSNAPFSKLEEWSSDVPTDYQYLMLKNIEEDNISKNLPYLTTIDEKNKKYILEEGDLLISRTAPFKVLVMPSTDGKKVMASGNMYFLRLDSKRVNPVYVMLFLRSLNGKKALNAYANGNGLVSLPLKSFENIMIPLIPLEEQNKIADKYNSLMQELEVVKAQEERIRENIVNLMEAGD